jgi:hypothetical protein
MKISFRRLDTHNSKPLFIMLSKFDMENFPVRVQHLRLAQTKPSKISSRIIRLEQPEIATPAARKNEPNWRSFKVVDTAPHVFNVFMTDEKISKGIKNV